MLAKKQHRIFFKADANVYVFKPNLPYQFRIQVTNLKNEPIRNSHSSLAVFVADDEGKILLEQDYELNENGEAYIEVAKMPFYSNSVEITAEYEDSSVTQSINRINSQKRHFLSLRVLTRM